jgi:hypothetical protein
LLCRYSLRERCCDAKKMQHAHASKSDNVIR